MKCTAAFLQIILWKLCTLKFCHSNLINMDKKMRRTTTQKNIIFRWTMSNQARLKNQVLSIQISNDNNRSTSKYFCLIACQLIFWAGILEFWAGSCKLNASEKNGRVIKHVESRFSNRGLRSCFNRQEMSGNLTVNKVFRTLKLVFEVVFRTRKPENVSLFSCFKLLFYYTRSVVFKLQTEQDQATYTV